MWILLSIRYLKGILVYLNTLITRFGNVGVFMTIIHAFLTLSPLDWVQLIGDSAWQGQRAEEGDVEKESTWQRNPRGSGEVRNHGLKVCWQRSSQRCQKRLRSRAKWGMSTVDLSSNGPVDCGAGYTRVVPTGLPVWQGRRRLVVLHTWNLCASRSRCRPNTLNKK